MGADTGDAAAASATSSRLMNQYSNVGVPALRQNMAYVRGALAQGEPQYVANAYQGAQTGALESSAAQMTGARARLAGNLAANGGGAYLGGLAQVQGTGSAALANEVGHIATTRAVAGIEQRNKLLNLMQGQGASATNLSAGFGSLTNEGLGQSAGANSLFGPLMGGLSAATSLYANSQLRQEQQRQSLAFDMRANPNLYGGNLGET